MHRRRIPWVLALALGLLFALSSSATAQVAVSARTTATTITAAPAFTPAGAYPTGSRAAERNAGFRNGRA